MKLLGLFATATLGNLLDGKNIRIRQVGCPLTIFYFLKRKFIKSKGNTRQKTNRGHIDKQNTEYNGNRDLIKKLKFLKTNKNQLNPVKSSTRPIGSRQSAPVFLSPPLDKLSLTCQHAPTTGPGQGDAHLSVW